MAAAAAARSLLEVLEAELVVFLRLAKLFLKLKNEEAQFLDLAGQAPHLLFHLADAHAAVADLRHAHRRRRRFDAGAVLAVEIGAFGRKTVAGKGGQGRRKRLNEKKREEAGDARFHDRRIGPHRVPGGPPFQLIGRRR